MQKIKDYLRQHNLTLKEDDFKPKFICSLCKELLEEPKITKCNCRFCKGCIEPYLTQINECPNCKCEINDPATEVVNDFGINKKICNLVITCPNQNCHIKMQIEQMPQHLSICINKEVKSVPTSTETGIHHQEDLSRRFRIVLDAIEKVNYEPNSKDQAIIQAKTQNDQIKELLTNSKENVEDVKKENLELDNILEKTKEKHRKIEECIGEQIAIMKNDLNEMKQTINGGERDNTDEIRYMRQRMAEMTKINQDNEANWKRILNDVQGKLEELKRVEREMKKTSNLEIFDLKLKLENLKKIAEKIRDTENTTKSTIEFKFNKLQKDFKDTLEMERKRLSQEIQQKIKNKMEIYDVAVSNNQYMYVFKEMAKNKLENNDKTFNSPTFRIKGYKFVILMKYQDDHLKFAVSLVKGDKDKYVTWPLRNVMTLMVFNDGGKNKENVAYTTVFCYNEAHLSNRVNYERPLTSFYKPIGESVIANIIDTDVIIDDKVAVMLATD